MAQKPKHVVKIFFFSFRSVGILGLSVFSQLYWYTINHANILDLYSTQSSLFRVQNWKKKRGKDEAKKINRLALLPEKVIAVKKVYI
jgi:hypothetical protein